MRFFYITNQSPLFQTKNEQEKRAIPKPFWQQKGKTTENKEAKDEISFYFKNNFYIYQPCE